MSGERRSGNGGKVFPYVSSAEEKEPDYARLARTLSDADLEDEILLGRGEPGYRLALITEHEARSRAGAPT